VIACITMGAFIHLRHFRGLQAKVQVVSLLRQLLAVTTFLGRIGCAAFPIMTGRHP
jgi:hypothetical protein